MSHCGLYLVGNTPFWSFTLGRQEVGQLQEKPSWSALAVTFPRVPKYFAPEAGAETRLQGAQCLACPVSIFAGFLPLLD